MKLSQNVKNTLKSALGCAGGAAIGGAYGCCLGGSVTQGIVGSQAAQFWSWCG